MTGLWKKNKTKSVTRNNSFHTSRIDFKTLFFLCFQVCDVCPKLAESWNTGKHFHRDPGKSQSRGCRCYNICDEPPNQIHNICFNICDTYKAEKFPGTRKTCGKAFVSNYFISLWAQHIQILVPILGILTLLAVTSLQLKHVNLNC